ncbi:MAG TPA: phage tail protein [Actinocrinis sp.]
MPKDVGLALRFDVQIDGVEVGTFSSCSGLSATYESFSWKEGGDNGTVVNLPGRLSYGTVTLTRSVDSDSGAIAAWFTAQQQAPARRTAVIRLYNPSGDVVAGWTLEGAWPTTYSGPQLAAGPDGEAAAIESLQLSHQGFSS